MNAEQQRFEDAARVEQDLGRVADGQAAGRLAESLAPEFERRHRAIEKKIYDRLAAGQVVDPQLALQCWIEKYELARLERELVHRQRRGERSAERVGPHMTVPQPGS